MGHYFLDIQYVECLPIPEACAVKSRGGPLLLSSFRHHSPLLPYLVFRLEKRLVVHKIKRIFQVLTPNNMYIQTWLRLMKLAELILKIVLTSFAEFLG